MLLQVCVLVLKNKMEDRRSKKVGSKKGVRHSDEERSQDARRGGSRRRDKEPEIEKQRPSKRRRDADHEEKTVPTTSDHRSKQRQIGGSRRSTASLPSSEEMPRQPEADGISAGDTASAKKAPGGQAAKGKKQSKRPSSSGSSSSSSSSSSSNNMQRRAMRKMMQMQAFTMQQQQQAAMYHAMQQQQQAQAMHHWQVTQQWQQHQAAVQQQQATAAATNHPPRLSQEEERRRREQDAKRREEDGKEAADTIMKATQKLRTATPDNIDDLKNELSQVLSAELPKCGRHKGRLKKESERALDVAQRNVTKQRELKKIQEKFSEAEKQKQESQRRAITIAEKLADLSNSIPKQEERLNLIGMPLEQADSITSDATLDEMSKELDATCDEASQLAIQGVAFLTESGSELRALLPLIRGLTPDQLNMSLASLFQKLNILHTVTGAARLRSSNAKRALVRRKTSRTEDRDRRKLFRKYDKDRDGFLSRREALRFAREELGFEMRDAALDGAWSNIVEEGSQGVAYADFQKLKVTIGIARELARDRCRKKKRIEEEVQAPQVPKAGENDSEPLSPALASSSTQPNTEVATLRENAEQVEYVDADMETEGVIAARAYVPPPLNSPLAFQTFTHVGRSPPAGSPTPQMFVSATMAREAASASTSSTLSSLLHSSDTSPISASVITPALPGSLTSLTTFASLRSLDAAHPLGVVSSARIPLAGANLFANPSPRVGMAPPPRVKPAGMSPPGASPCAQAALQMLLARPSLAGPRPLLSHLRMPLAATAAKTNTFTSALLPKSTSALASGLSAMTFAVTKGSSGAATSSNLPKSIANISAASGLAKSPLSTLPAGCLSSLANHINGACASTVAGSAPTRPSMPRIEAPRLPGFAATAPATATAAVVNPKPPPRQSAPTDAAKDAAKDRTDATKLADRGDGSQKQRGGLRAWSPSPKRRR